MPSQHDKQPEHRQPQGTWTEPKPTALLVLADGTVLEGFGLGAIGHAVGRSASIPP
jgi:carbamoyl-phosphate synthase small subunit